MTMLSARRVLAVLIFLVLFAGSPLASLSQELIVAPSEFAQQISVELPSGFAADSSTPWRLVEQGQKGASIPAQLTTGADKQGRWDDTAWRLLAIIPPGDSERCYLLQEIEPSDQQSTPSVPRFLYTPVSSEVVQLSENGQPVLAYAHGQVTDPEVPETDGRRTRGCFIHPIWGLDGEVLTDSFPADHFHHHGLFWAWPTVKVGDRTFDHWLHGGELRTKQVRELGREVGPLSAVLAVENGWFTETGEQVMTERVWMRAWQAEGDRRVLDIDLTLIPGEQDVTLQGQGEKSYGGLALRFNVWPRTSAVVRTPTETLSAPGRKSLAANKDLVNRRLPWVDLTDDFSHDGRLSGAAVFVHPDHPDYEPAWLTRCYGPQCVGWPGIEAQTLKAGVPVTLRYRILIHRGEVETEQLSKEYAAYTVGAKAAWAPRE